jgi:hypothetical protein
MYVKFCKEIDHKHTYRLGIKYCLKVNNYEHITIIIIIIINCDTIGVLLCSHLGKSPVC